jgi:hypothetical protein
VSETIEVREDMLIHDFRRDYRTALKYAEIQHEHTQTAGWQAIVAAFQASQMNGRRDVSARLQMLGKQIANYGITEADVKAIGDCKKSAEEIRIAAECFDRDVVEPIRSVAEEPKRVIENFRRQARYRQEHQPLVDSGILEAMNAAIAAFPNVGWDSEKWTVEMNGEMAQ